MSDGAAPILDQARMLGDYEAASRLRQARDLDRLLDLAPADARRFLDLCCGTGALIERAIARLPHVRHAAGIDLLPSRLVEAERRLHGVTPEISLIPADLSSPPALARRFDLVTMTSALHWLHPNEARVFAWVASVTARPGTFLLSTYHPPADSDGFGGTDHLVCEALARLGLDHAQARARFAEAGVLPIATRTLTPDAVEAALSRYFTVERCEVIEAEMRVDGAAQYRRYHAATFGTYFAALAGTNREPDFFEAIGLVAEARMREADFVTRMPVRLWRGQVRAGLDA